MKHSTPAVDTAGELLARVAGGDHDALVGLYELTSRTVLRSANAILRSVEHAEEVRQEVYLQIWLSAAAAFTPSLGSGHGFIIALTRRRAIDRIRHVERSRNRDTAWVDSDELWWDFSDVTTDRIRLQAALSALGERAQTIVAIYYHGLTYKELAQQLGVTVAVVKNRHHRALVALRGLVQATP